MTDLATFLKTRRDLLGWTQTRLAEEAAITKSHLSQIESGKIALPSAEIRRRLAQALGVSHTDLLIAAGELTTEELTRSATAPQNPFPPDDPRYAIVELLLYNDPATVAMIRAIMAFAERHTTAPEPIAPG